MRRYVLLLLQKSNLYPLHDPVLLSRIENAYEQVRLKPWLSSLDAILELVVKEQFFKVNGDKHIGEVGLKKLPDHLRTVDEYFFKESPHYMVGTELSIADIQLACLLSQLELIKFDIAAFPAINKFWLHIQTTPHFQGAHKDYYAALVATGVRK